MRLGSNQAIAKMTLGKVSHDEGYCVSSDGSTSSQRPKLEVDWRIEDTQTSYYYLGGRRVALRAEEGQEDDVYWLHTDHLGSTSLLSDDEGDLEAGTTTRFLPFGDYCTEPSSDLTDKGFTGHAHNDPLGLVFMRARFFVPGVGRFASADTIVPQPKNPQSMNRYSWVLNNPLRFVDPSGHNQLDHWRTAEIFIDEPGDLDQIKPPYPGAPRIDENWSENFSEDVTRLDDWQHPGWASPINPLPDAGWTFRNPLQHRGVDYPDSEGTELQASTHGLVVISDECSHPNCIQMAQPQRPDRFDASVNGGYGNVIIIEYPFDNVPASVAQTYGLENGQSLFVLYAHLVDPLGVEIGDTVEQGMVFGGVGNTGNSTGPHLHVEVRIGASGVIWDTQLCRGTCGDTWRTWRSLDDVDPQASWD